MTLKLKRREILLALGTLLWVSACQSNSTDNQQPNSPSRRIVALEWSFVESLLALGIQPVGVADISGYKEYVNIPPKLTATVQDIGTRQEPNLEAIAQLKPDLILGVSFRQKGILSALETIAPTRLFDFYSQEINQLTRFKEIFLEIAQLTDRAAIGKTKLQQLETTIKEAKATLREKRLTDRPIVLAELVATDSPFRIFTDDAFPIQLLSAIGLKNAWQGNFSQYGFNRIGMESLSDLKAVNFIYVPPDENPEIEKEITSKSLWKKMEFVQADRVYRLAGDTWLYGGILSSELLIKQVVSQLSQ